MDPTIAIWSKHVRRKLQIHHPRHLGPPIRRTCPTAPTDLLPIAQHALRILRPRTHEQLHRKLIRRRGAYARRSARNGHSQFEIGD